MDAHEALARAGWRPGREKRIARQERALRKEGYELFPAARAFLTGFSGLTVRWSHEGHEIKASIDGAEAAGLEDRECVQDYARRVGSDLVPVGESSHTILLIAEDGRFFGGFGDLLVPLGSSPLELFELLMQRPHGVYPNITREGLTCVVADREVEELRAFLCDRYGSEVDDLRLSRDGEGRTEIMSPDPASPLLLRIMDDLQQQRGDAESRPT